MINNNGFCKKVFFDLLELVQVGGFIVFATKLNYFKQDIYAAEIKQLQEEGHWNFTAEHQFFRYDMLADKMGKFSTKLVKVLAYQKSDYEARMRADAEERARLEEEARKAEAAAEAAAPTKKKKKKKGPGGESDNEENKEKS